MILRHFLGGGATRFDGIRPDDYAKLGAALDRTATMARDMGVHASFHPHMGSLVESPEQLDRVMACSTIALCPDCAHIYLGGGDPLHVIQKYVDRIRYVHLKNVELSGSFCTLTRGTIDFDPIMRLLVMHPDIELAIEDDGTKAEPLSDAILTLDYLKKWL